MPTRRTTLALLAATLATPALAARDNPMPEALRRDLERDPNAPVLGNPQGDITLTEFFDYNCPHCRVMMPRMTQLIGSEPKLRVVFREWPIFGEGSIFAARASLASLRQGKYWQLHSALMTTPGRVVEATVLRAARGAGLDIERMRRDMEGPQVEAHLARSAELADHMGLAGTPSFVCGDGAAFGELSLAELRRFVAEARATLAG